MKEQNRRSTEQQGDSEVRRELRAEAARRQAREEGRELWEERRRRIEGTGLPDGGNTSIPSVSLRGHLQKINPFNVGKRASHELGKVVLGRRRIRY